MFAQGCHACQHLFSQNVKIIWRESEDVTPMNPSVKKIPCVILSIAEGKTWNNIVVQRKVSKKRLFFGKAKKDLDTNVGDEAYLEIEVMPSELTESPLRVTLYDMNDVKLDWTIIQPSQIDNIR
jgi:hypothetical protein